MSRLAIALVVCLPACAPFGDGPGDLFASMASRLDRTSPTVLRSGIDLPPAAKPGRAAFGDRRIVDLISGRETTLRLSASGNRIRVEDASGCRSTKLMDWFSPSVAWSGCGTSDDWQTGRAKVGVRTAPYPMTVGARGRYQRWATSHTGKTSMRTTDCVVRDAVTIAAGRRETDAFVVECDDGRVRRTTWLSPAEGPVAYREEHRTRGLREAWVVSH